MNRQTNSHSDYSRGLHRPGKALEFDLAPEILLEFEISALCFYRFLSLVSHSKKSSVPFHFEASGRLCYVP